MADNLQDGILLDSEQIIVGDERRETQALRGPIRVTWIDVEMARIAAPPQIPRYHHNDGFLDFLIVPVVLYDNRRPDLRPSWFREGEIHHDDVTSAGHGFLPYFCW